MTDTIHEDPIARAANAMIRFYRHLDDSDYDGMADLLDGEWHRQGKVIGDRDALMAAMAGRSATRRIHHLLTNVAGVVEADGTVTLTAYMLVVQHDAGTPLDGPAPLTGFTNIRTVRARAGRGADGWQIRWLKSDAASFAA
ncbi:hypothetical protein ATO6_01445 [Oceanicola sp. 22II-s10i]|uniref:nuclear transport factor 2 family protein n=1 Tax=Oceanicola sp. 22II-s10i TaxID=1317116 RepID=UPI000B526EDD|nr:nuclear transport factor 2 family protein [Oceanicola sp. 22II-s10i]OWU85623.1 hypothetical protein ATO6_01445 [Oceanicola sp. 22II-s10i]